MTPCPARTRSLTKRARRAPSKDPVSFDWNMGPPFCSRPAPICFEGGVGILIESRSRFVWKLVYYVHRCTYMYRYTVRER